MYKEIEGDLIQLGLQGSFDVIGHGVNCQNTQKAGIAAVMANVFATHSFFFESPEYKGDINKLGQIDVAHSYVKAGKGPLVYNRPVEKRWADGTQDDENYKLLKVVNMYTQFNYGRNHTDGNKAPLDYEALTLCLRKMNKVFKGKHIGLPAVGCGLAGGEWGKVQKIIQSELTDCDITVVILKTQHI